MRRIPSKLPLFFLIVVTVATLFLLSSCDINSMHVHNYESTTIPPTCTEEGYQTNVCSCGENFINNRTPAKGHTEVVDPGKAPTCTESGITDGITCGVCGVTLQEKTEVPPTPHAYAEEYSFDENGHFHLCECGEENGREGHISAGPATVFEAEVCAVCNYTMLPQTGLAFPDFVVEGMKETKRVNHQTETISIADLGIQIVGDTTFTVYLNEECTVQAGERLTLLPGANTIYVKECHSGVENVHLLVVYRLHLYTVEFIIADDYPSEFVTVEEGSLVTPPTVSREGYEFIRWNFLFHNPITEDTQITSVWRSKNDTKYTIIHYIQNITDDGYSVYLTDATWGETGAPIHADPITIEHFTFNRQASVTDGTILADGSAELKLYYDREMYDITISDAKAGRVIGLGSFRYGTFVNVEAFENIGYHFSGWYSGDEYLTDLERTFFEIYCDIEARYEVGSYMNGFTFESTENSCTILGVPKNTTGVVRLPDCATAIAPGAFRDMTALTIIYIPMDVTSIGAYAFSGITAQIVFEIGFFYETIGENTFSGYLGASITIPPSVKTIEKNAFANCSSEIFWADGARLETVGEGAFNDYKGNSLTLPARVNKIEKNAFTGCVFIRILFLGTAQEWANITIVAEGNAIVLQIKVYIYAETNPEREGDYWVYDENYTVVIYPQHIHTEAVLKGHDATCTESGLTDGIYCSVCEKVFEIQQTIPAKGHTEVTHQGYPATCAYAGKRDGKICSTCGLETVVRTTIPQLAHSTSGSACTVCGELPATSANYLTFTYNSTYGGYFVSAKSGTTLPEMLIIPTKYNSANVVGIADNGFKNNKNIRYVKLHDQIKYIGTSAFQSCGNLQNIFIPNSVTEVKSNAFALYSNYSANVYIEYTSVPTTWASNWSSYCKPVYGVRGMVHDTDGSILAVLSDGSLRYTYCANTATGTYTIPSEVMSSPVTSIAPYAFLNDRKHQTICVPATVKNVLSLSLYVSNNNVHSVIISSGVETVESGAVQLNYTRAPYIMTDAESLPSGWHANWSTYRESTYYGVLEFVFDLNAPYIYALRQNDAILLYCNTSGYGAFTIPETIADKTVTVLGCRAMEGKGFTTVTLPNTLKEIGAYCFRYSSVQNIILGKGIEKIGENAFDSCESLKSITFPCAIAQIGEDIFAGCSALESIVLLEMQVIPNGLFSGLTKLTTVALPEGLIEIGNDAFYGCISLSDIKLPSTLKTIGERAFNSCSALRSIVLPEGLTTLGFAAFANTGIEEIRIPATFTELPENLFLGCTSLGRVTLPDTILSIGDYAFYHCTALGAIALPEGLKSIGQYAFDGCETLLCVYLPQSIETIGANAFHRDAVLASAFSSIPDGWSVTDIILDAVGIGVYQDQFIYSIAKSNVIVIEKALTVPECFEIPSQIDGTTVSVIAPDAFADCTNLQTLTLPETVTTIGNGAFRGCTSLRYVFFLAPQCSLGTDAFASAPADVTLLFASAVNELIVSSFPEGTMTYDSVCELYYTNDLVLVKTDAGYTVVYTTRSTIPSSVDGTPVVSIGHKAFHGIEKTLYLPSTVTDVAPDAFVNSPFTRVFFGAFKANITGLDVTQYPAIQFVYGYSDTDLTSEEGFLYRTDEDGNAYLKGYVGEATEVTIPDKIGDYTVCDYERVFYENTTITKVTINSKLNTVSPYAFYGCTALQTVSLNSYIRSLGDYAFYNCYGIKAFPISGITTFGHYSMYGCSNAYNYMVIPANTIYIGDYAFAKCHFQSGNGITLNRNTLQYIGSYAFEDCTIYKVTIQGKNLVIADYAFFNLPIETLTLSGVKSIGAYAFAHTKITSLDVYCESIGDYAFYACYLETLSFEAKHVGSWVFAGNSNITEVFISDTVETLGANVFNGCRNLTEIRIKYKSIPTTWNPYWNGGCSAKILYGKYS